ncbi:MAG: NAD-binding protein [Phycisphaerales bacterium]|nr:NAD-binding protein [Phycisphaerales bacterium]
MRDTLRIELLETTCDRRSAWRWRLWREWCFIRTVFHVLRYRLLVLFSLLIGGGLLFQHLGDDRSLSLVEASYYTWALVFGEAPQAFPDHPLLELMFFVVPVIGLTIVLEGLIELALLVRDRRRSEREWCKAMCKAMKDHVILVGLGRLGYRTFTLLRKLGVPVVVIENSPTNQFLEDVRRDGSPLLIGDGRREALLIDANVAEARSIVLATTNDLANLEIALDARKLSPDIRVVLRMFDQNMADKIAGGFNIHLAISQSAISAPAFALAALEPELINSVVVENKLIVMKRWTVQHDGPLAGLSVSELMDRYELAVVEHRPQSGPTRLFPPTATRLAPGDQVIVQGAFEALAKLRMAPTPAPQDARTPRS